MARQTNPNWLMVFAAAVAGAAAMFLLDPDKGKRRRALARDKIGSAMRHGRHAVSAAARDATQRLQGVRAEANRRHRREGYPDDLLLIERVRARLGRVVAHPHAIQVGANRGVVVLSGPILAAEVAALLEATRAVPGVVAIEDHLAVYQSSEHIPSLQDGDTRH